MKEIKTKRFIDKKADLIVHPPIDKEVERLIKKDKKKKKIYQLNKEVDDVSINDLAE